MEKIYEVLRVLEARPVFLKEHMERLDKSWRFYRQEPLNLLEIENAVKDLSAKRNDPHNIRIEVGINEGDFKLSTVEGKYPSPAMKAQGVELAKFEHQRHNPQVKAIDTSVQDQIEAYRTQQDVYSLLYTHDGEIGECERANIFFVRDGVLITAKDEDVLLGVTRAKVLEVAQDLNIPVIKRTISVDEVFTMEAAFMTGTSIHVLPVARIDEDRFDPKHELVVKLSHELDSRIYGSEKEETKEAYQGQASSESRASKEKKLFKSSRDKKIAGVCGGIADYFELDSSIIRILAVILVIFTKIGMMASIVGYFVMALILPEKEEI